MVTHYHKLNKNNIFKFKTNDITVGSARKFELSAAFLVCASSAPAQHAQHVPLRHDSRMPRGAVTISKRLALRHTNSVGNQKRIWFGDLGLSKASTTNIASHCSDTNKILWYF